jgi:hypothetical protein
MDNLACGVKRPGSNVPAIPGVNTATLVLIANISVCICQARERVHLIVENGPTWGLRARTLRIKLVRITNTDRRGKKSWPNSDISRLWLNACAMTLTAGMMCVFRVVLANVNPRPLTRLVVVQVTAYTAVQVANTDLRLGEIYPSPLFCKDSGD